MLNAKVSGSGLPVVLIHGFAEDLSLWEGITPALAEKYQVIALDLPGFGKSSPLPAPFSLDQVAEKVHHYLHSELDIKNYVVLGHSLGGYVSLALAELFPDNILGFGLINSTAFADSEEKKALRDKTVEFINKNGPAFFLEPFVPNLFTEANQKTLTSEIEQVRNMGKSLSVEVLAAYMRAMRNRPDRTAVLKTPVPAFIAGGLQDAHVPYKDVQLQINMLANKGFGHLYPEIAHMAMYEAKNELKNDLQIFLKEIKT